MTAGFEAIAREIAAQLGGDCAPEPQSGVSGGSIHRSYRWPCGDRPLFVKVAEHSGAAGLEAEATGLMALAGAHAVRAPRVLARGMAGHSAFLALEWIESRPAGRPAEHRLGEQLAAQHRVSAQQFGFASDNFIGRTPQPNGWLPDWAEFFRERRLRHQLVLARRTASRGCSSQPARGCSSRWPRCSRATARRPRCCTVISGPATGSRMSTRSR